MALLHKTKILFFLSFSLALSLTARAKTSPAYWISGETHQDTVVLIHGFNDSHETWNKVVPILAEHFRVVVYDQPGHGESKAEGKDFSPRYMAQQLKSLLDLLEIRSAHIVGHSMGGRTALEFASHFPEITKSLLVEDMSALSIPESVKVLPAVFAKFDKVKENVPCIFPNYSKAVSTLSNYYSTFEAVWLLSSAKTLPNKSLKLGNRPEVTQLYLHQGLAEDMTSQLKAVKAKMLFFAADPQSGTAVLTGKGIEHIHAVRPDVEVKVFPKLGHMIHYSPQFIAPLLEFLNR